MTDPNLAAPRDAKVREALVQVIRQSDIYALEALARELSLWDAWKEERTWIGGCGLVADALLAPREARGEPDNWELAGDAALEGFVSWCELGDDRETAEKARTYLQARCATSLATSRGTPPMTTERFHVDTLDNDELRANLVSNHAHPEGFRAVALDELLRRLAAPLPAERGREDALPPDESPQRNALCDAMTKALLFMGEVAGEAGERTFVDLTDEAQVRGLMRLLTTRDAMGRDGDLGTATRTLWNEVRAALSPDAGGKP